jgi:AcrR family transcriptional regulator
VIDVTVVTPDSGLRERKKARTRHAIEACALELFLSNGYEATTIDAITAACDISPRTFFRYFSSKDDILQGDNDVRLARLLQLLRDRPAGESPMRALREAVVALTGLYEDDREHLLLRFRVFERNPDLLARGLESQHAWEQAIVNALDERHGAVGFLYDRLELRLIAASGMAALRAAVDVWQTVDGAEALSTLVARAFDRLAGGLDSHPHSNGDTSSNDMSSRKAVR